MVRLIPVPPSAEQKQVLEGRLVKLVIERCTDRPGFLVIGTFRQVTKVIEQLQGVGVTVRHAPWSFDQGTWITVISDEVYEKHKTLVEDWMNMPAEDPKAVPETKPEPTYLDYDTFQKVELVAGTITAADRIPKKDKLLKLTVDLGEPTPRTIVAGLALTFQPPEMLVGLQVVVVANLAPRDFGKGLTSHGMILATGEPDSLKLVRVTSPVPNGSRLK
jgi:methionine--tRNA ligase beta chain